MCYIVDIFINIAENMIEVQLTLAYNVLFEINKYTHLCKFELFTYLDMTMFEYILEMLFLSFGGVR